MARGTVLDEPILPTPIRAIRSPSDRRKSRPSTPHKSSPELVTTDESAVFIRAMMGLRKGLNLSVTAEGIETEVQAAAALQHGVD